MPSLSDSIAVDGSQLQPVAPAGVPPPQPATGMQEPSPLMQSSLPAMAAGSDQYVRQFYNRSNCPTQRILPAGIAE